MRSALTLKRLHVLAICTATVIVAGCADPSTAPAPAAPTAVPTAVVIIGAPEGPMKARSFARLTAATAMRDGTTATCAEVTWQSSNATSVGVALDGTLQAQDVPGSATITARCRDLSAAITVAVGRTLTVDLWVRELEPRLAGGFGQAFWLPVPDAVAEILDGPDRGSTFLPSAGANPFLLLPVRIRLRADGYLPSEHQIDAPPDHAGREVMLDLPLTPTPAPPGALERSGAVPRGSVATHDFHAERDGVLSVRLWWSQEYSTRMDMDLRCRGELKKSTHITAQSHGDGFDADVPAGPCSLTLSPRGGLSQQAYRVRMALR
jgi:hypothetical protein